MLCLGNATTILRAARTEVANSEQSSLGWCQEHAIWDFGELFFFTPEKRNEHIFSHGAPTTLMSALVMQRRYPFSSRSHGRWCRACASLASFLLDTMARNGQLVIEWT